MVTDSILIITYYIAGLLLNAFLAMGLSIIILRARHKSGSVWLGLLFLAGAWWSLTILGELLIDTLPAKIFWSKLQYPGAVSVPVLMFLFVLNYCHRHKWLASRYLLLYWIPPLIAVLLAATNEWHYLIWTDFTPRLVGGSTIIVYGHGPAYWGIIAYSYLLLLVSVGLLIQTAWRQTGLQRRQVIFLLLIILLPWLAEFGYNLTILPGLDFTVFGLTLSGILMLWNLSRLNLLSLIPVAIDQVFEEMQHAVIVLDNRHYVVNFNPSAQKILDMTPDTIGYPVNETLARCLDHDPQIGCEIEWTDQPPRTLSVSVVPLSHRKKRKIGYLMMCRDITAQKQARQEQWERQLALAVLEERQQNSTQLHAETRQILEHIVSLAHSAVHLLEDEHNAAAATTMSQLVEIARNSGADIDEFIQNLRAGDVGPAIEFFQAMTRYVNYFNQTHNLTVSLTHPLQPPDSLLSSASQIQLLQIVQDVLLHTVRQAHAQAAQIVISTSDNWVQTVITLQGGTFGETVESRSVLDLLKQRAVAVQGRLEIRPIPGQGSHVIVHLPRLEPAPAQSLATMKILLVDDHRVLLAGFKELLEQQGANVVGGANNGTQAIKLARELQPDIILMDVRMPGMSGIEATRRIKAEFPEIKVVMLTVSQDQSDLFEALRAGAGGYLLKTVEPEKFFDLLTGVVKGNMPLPPEMVEQLATDITQTEDDIVAAGVPLLTSQQLDVLRLVAGGYTYREVGDQLHISEHTVRYHIEQIRSKLNVSKRAEMVARAIQLGLVEPRSS